ncbi:MAG TPA: CBS domain-containing protein, partial [Acidimicrobiales bacterium]
MAEPTAKTGPNRTVADVMTTDVLTASPSDTVAKTCARMLERSGGKVGSAIVTEGDRALGIFTERDLVRAAAAGADLDTARVSDWMSSDPDTVPPDMELSAAYVSLSEHGYRHFPVVEDGRLAGVISMRDMLRIAFVRPVEHPSLIEAPKGLEGVVVAETAVGDVRGQEGFYHYRQYNATELAEKRSLEDVWHLLYQGHLPDAAERESFAEEIRSLRDIPPSVKDLLPA